MATPHFFQIQWQHRILSNGSIPVITPVSFLISMAAYLSSPSPCQGVARTVLVTRVLGSGSGSATLSLPMVNGQLYLSCVRAVNRAGIYSDALCSDGKTLDNTPPSAGQLTDGSGDQFISTVGVPCAFWTGAGDAESGIAAMSLSLMRVDGDEQEQVGPAEAVGGTLSGSGSFCRSQPSLLEQGASYYSLLKLTNGAGGCRM